MPVASLGRTATLEEVLEGAGRARWLLARVIARPAAFAASKIDGFHVAIAGAQPAQAGESWGYSEGTAQGE